MLCNALKSLATTDLLAQIDVLERIALETPQVVYIVRCHACRSTHSIEFSIDDEVSSRGALGGDVEVPTRGRVQEQRWKRISSRVKGRAPGALHVRPARLPLGQRYDEGEVFAALDELSQKEIEQILRFARSRLVGNSARPGYVEVEDLFADAVLRTMERRRCWTHGVSVFNHFFGVMRSIGNQRLRQAGRFMPLNDWAVTAQDRSLSALDARSTVARLEERLHDDAVALQILESMADEVKPKCAQQALGIRAKVYWAARKRIRRAAEGLARDSSFRRRGNATEIAGKIKHPRRSCICSADFAFGRFLFVGSNSDSCTQ